MSRWLIIGLYQELLLVSSSRKGWIQTHWIGKWEVDLKALRLVGLKKSTTRPRTRYGWFGLKVWEGARLLLCSGLKIKGKKSFPNLELNFLPSENFSAFETISFLEMTLLDPQEEGSNHCWQMEVSKFLRFIFSW